MDIQRTPKHTNPLLKRGQNANPAVSDAAFRISDHEKTTDTAIPGIKAPSADASVLAVSPARRRRVFVAVLATILVVCLCVAGGGIGYVVWQNQTMGKSPAPDEELLEASIEKQAQQAAPDEAKAIPNPIDFAALQAENPDIYAWLYIPGADINLPVLQSPTADGFYLSHNRYGEKALEGAIYTEMANAKDFSDPVTVIYGHNTTNHTMFGNLHYFENPEFFAEHRTFYLYTSDHLLTYEVISAFQYDNRHILNSFNFGDTEVVQTYFDSVANPDSLIKNVSGATAPVAGIDRIVQLSTCTGDSNRYVRRYLVTGVLVNDVSLE